MSIEHRLPNAYAGIYCKTCGEVDIDLAEYEREMARPDSAWTCPICGSIASFDDDRFEELNPEPLDDFEE